jgi:hypothetical protein
LLLLLLRQHLLVVAAGSGPRVDVAAGLVRQQVLLLLAAWHVWLTLQHLNWQEPSL